MKYPSIIHQYSILTNHTHHHPIIIPRTILKLSNIMTGNGLIYIYHLQKNADVWGVCIDGIVFPTPFTSIQAPATPLGSPPAWTWRVGNRRNVWCLMRRKIGKKGVPCFSDLILSSEFLSLEAFEAHVSSLWVLHSSFLCLVPCWNSRKASQPRNKQFLGPISRSETQKVYADSCWLPGAKHLGWSNSWKFNTIPKMTTPRMHWICTLWPPKTPKWKSHDIQLIIGSFHGAYLHIDQLPSPLTTSPAQLRLSKSFPWSDCDISEVTELRPFKALTNCPLCERSPGHWTSGAQWGPMGPNGAMSAPVCWLKHVRTSTNQHQLMSISLRHDHLQLQNACTHTLRV